MVNKEITKPQHTPLVIRIPGIAGSLIRYGIAYPLWDRGIAYGIPGIAYGIPGSRDRLWDRGIAYGIIGKNRIEDSRFFHILKKRAFPFFGQTILGKLSKNLN